MYSLYLILGLNENAPNEAVESAYQRLSGLFKLENFAEQSLGYIQCKQCRQSIESAYNTLKEPSLKQRYQEQWKAEIHSDSPTDLHPKLGQLCVASGMITLAQLEEAVRTQSSLDLPLGQVLQENTLLSQAELDGLLLGQNLISLPADTPHALGQRLLALGLVTEDMVRIALIEQRTFGKRIGEQLVHHQWLDPEILEILLADSTSKPVDTPRKAT